MANASNNSVSTLVSATISVQIAIVASTLTLMLPINEPPSVKSLQDPLDNIAAVQFNIKAKDYQILLRSHFAHHSCADDADVKQLKVCWKWNLKIFEMVPTTNSSR
uniref:Uncharacterized protein n=1 Tax=Glossina austeni TaxID=7395 RepID=A0A1A9UI18_GLOAU